MGNFLESLFDALIELVFQKGEKKNRKKSWKQFLKDNREEAKRRDEEIMALPFKEKVIRSSKFILRVIGAGIVTIIFFIILLELGWLESFLQLF
tara:strand:+ start:460 stop:741 length:282 start_codon:yes stop_codon:yes gene_type:complete